MKKFFKKLKIADYWHVEIFVLAPVIVLWTILLAIIAFNSFK